MNFERLKTLLLSRWTFGGRTKASPLSVPTATLRKTAGSHCTDLGQTQCVNQMSY